MNTRLRGFIVLLPWIILASCNKAESEWKTTRAADTISAYQAYVARHATSLHAAEARERVRTLEWQAARSANTRAALDEHIKRHPDTPHLAEAKAMLEALAWTEAVKTDTFDSFAAFLRSYPETKRLKATRGLVSLNRQLGGDFEFELGDESSGRSVFSGSIDSKTAVRLGLLKISRDNSTESFIDQSYSYELGYLAEVVIGLAPRETLLAIKRSGVSNRPTMTRSGNMFMPARATLAPASQPK